MSSGHLEKYCGRIEAFHRLYFIQWPYNYRTVKHVELWECILIPCSNYSLFGCPTICYRSKSSLPPPRCIVDSTFQYMDVEQRKTKRFTLKAFHFMSTHSVVYLHAYVKICNDSVEKLVLFSFIQSRVNYQWYWIIAQKDWSMIKFR